MADMQQQQQQQADMRKSQAARKSIKLAIDPSFTSGVAPPKKSGFQGRGAGPTSAAAKFLDRQQKQRQTFARKGVGKNINLAVTQAVSEQRAARGVMRRSNSFGSTYPRITNKSQTQMLEGELDEYDEREANPSKPARVSKAALTYTQANRVTFGHEGADEGQNMDDRADMRKSRMSRKSTANMGRSESRGSVYQSTEGSRSERSESPTAGSRGRKSTNIGAVMHQDTNSTFVPARVSRRASGINKRASQSHGSMHLQEMHREVMRRRSGASAFDDDEESDEDDAFRGKPQDSEFKSIAKKSDATISVGRTFAERTEDGQPARASTALGIAARGSVYDDVIDDVKGAGLAFGRQVSQSQPEFKELEKTVSDVAGSEKIGFSSLGSAGLSSPTRSGTRSQDKEALLAADKEARGSITRRISDNIHGPPSKQGMRNSISANALDEDPAAILLRAQHTAELATASPMHAKPIFAAATFAEKMKSSARLGSPTSSAGLGVKSPTDSMGISRSQSPTGFAKSTSKDKEGGVPDLSDAAAQVYTAKEKAEQTKARAEERLAFIEAKKAEKAQLEELAKQTKKEAVIGARKKPGFIDSDEVIEVGDEDDPDGEASKRESRESLEPELADLGHIPEVPFTESQNAEMLKGMSESKALEHMRHQEELKEKIHQMRTEQQDSIIETEKEETEAHLGLISDRRLSDQGETHEMLDPNKKMVIKNTLRRFIGAFAIRINTDKRSENTALRNIVLKDYDVDSDLAMEELADYENNGSFGKFLFWLDHHRFWEGGQAYIIYRYMMYISALICFFSGTYSFAFEHVCYDDPQYLQWRTMFVVNSVFYLILALPMRVCFTWIDLESRCECTKTREIFSMMMETRQFWVDLLSAPLLYFELQAPKSVPEALAESTTPIHLTPCYVHLFGKLLIILRAKRLFDEKEIQDNMYLNIFSLFLLLILVTHIFCCLYTWAALNQRFGSNRASWIDDWLDVKMQCFDLWQVGMYFSGATFFTIGYGDITPVNSAERLTSIAVMLLGQMTLAKVFAELNWITSTAYEQKSQFLSRMTQMAAALRSMGMPSSITNRVLCYTEYVDTLHKEKQMNKYWRDLSPSLRDELALATYCNLVIDANFFRGQPSRVVLVIVQSFHDRVHLPGDFIVRKNENGNELFFLRSGEATVLLHAGSFEDQSSQVATLSEGQHFGEVALLSGKPRTAWIMAKTYCIVSILFKEVFDKLNSQFPGCFVDLIKSMRTLSNVKPHINLGKVTKKVLKTFEDLEEAYMAFAHKTGTLEGLLSAEEWTESMESINVSQLDARLLWCELDEQSSGYVDFGVFAEKLTEALEAEEELERRKMEEEQARLEEEERLAAEEAEKKRIEEDEKEKKQLIKDGKLNGDNELESLEKDEEGKIIKIFEKDPEEKDGDGKIIKQESKTSQSQGQIDNRESLDPGGHEVKYDEDGNIIQQSPCDSITDSSKKRDTGHGEEGSGGFRHHSPKSRQTHDRQTNNIQHKISTGSQGLGGHGRRPTYGEEAGFGRHSGMGDFAGHRHSGQAYDFDHQGDMGGLGAMSGHGPKGHMHSLHAHARRSLHGASVHQHMSQFHQHGTNRKLSDGMSALREAGGLKPLMKGGEKRMLEQLHKQLKENRRLMHLLVRDMIVRIPELHSLKDEEQLQSAIQDSVRMPKLEDMPASLEGDRGRSHKSLWGGDMGTMLGKSLMGEDMEEIQENDNINNENDESRRNSKDENGEEIINKDSFLNCQGLSDLKAQREAAFRESEAGRPTELISDKNANNDNNEEEDIPKMMKKISRTLMPGETGSEDENEDDEDSKNAKEVDISENTDSAKKGRETEIGKKWTDDFIQDVNKGDATMQKADSSANMTISPNSINQTINPNSTLAPSILRDKSSDKNMKSPPKKSVTVLVHDSDTEKEYKDSEDGDSKDDDSDISSLADNDTKSAPSNNDKSSNSKEPPDPAFNKMLSKSGPNNLYNGFH